MTLEAACQDSQTHNSRNHPITSSAQAFQQTVLGVMAGGKQSDRILHSGATPRDASYAIRSGERTHDDGYAEERYLIAFPDIGRAVKMGEWQSGLDHYLKHGAAENRLDDPRYLNAELSQDTPTFPAGGIDATFVSPGGWCLVIGWFSDETAPLRRIACLRDGQVVATVPPTSPDAGARMPRVWS